jgi:proliferating cell nuclear antigen
MEFIINQPKKAALFTSFFQHIKILTEHVNIHFETDRLYMQAMDSSQVSIFEIIIPKEWFDSYKIDSDYTTTIGVRTTILFTVLSIRATNQHLKVQFRKENSDKLFVHYTGEEGGIFDRFIEMPLMEIDSELLCIPEMEYTVDVSLSSKEFATIIHQMKEFGETIEFHCTEESVDARGKSTEKGILHANIPISSLSGYAIGNDVKQCFSLKYLSTICLYDKIAKEISVHFHEDSPMYVHYTIPALVPEGVEPPIAHIKFYLAPKMDDDEE